MSGLTGGRSQPAVTRTAAPSRKATASPRRESARSRAQASPWRNAASIRPSRVPSPRPCRPVVASVTARPLSPIGVHRIIVLQVTFMTAQFTPVAVEDLEENHPFLPPGHPSPPPHPPPFHP